jgi:hypothetical protein
VEFPDVSNPFRNIHASWKPLYIDLKSILSSVIFSNSPIPKA